MGEGGRKERGTVTVMAGEMPKMGGGRGRKWGEERREKRELTQKKLSMGKL